MSHSDDAEYDAEGGQSLLPAGGDTWVVQEGDSLWTIAELTYGDGMKWPQIRDANPDRVLDGGDLIMTGTELSLPVLEPDDAVGEGVGEPAEAIQARIEETEHGTYEVYPDNAPISLVPADRNDESIAITETAFAELHRLMQGIADDTAGIDIEGDEDFEAAVKADLGWLLSQSVGRDLLTLIVAAGKEVTIENTGGGNACVYHDDDASWQNDDGTAGEGTDVTVRYNPIEWNPYGGGDAWMRRPPAIGLAHELVHAWTGVTGTRARGQDAQGVNEREKQATGLGGWEDAALTENRFRAAFGLPDRPRY